MANQKRVPLVLLMKDLDKLAYFFKNYSVSLQRVVYARTGNFFHDNQRKPVQLIYLCPLCLKNKIAIVGEYQHLDSEFSLDHFPPASVGGRDTVLVCEDCNSASGSDFEHSLKDFIREQSAVNWIPGSKIPVTLNVEGIKGNYKGSLIVKAPYDFEWDFVHYPLLASRFERMFKGESMIQNIIFKKRELDLVYKSLLKSAYLFCFSRWKYDFIYSNTATRIRNILFGNETHPLSNSGVFFHTKHPFPPVGLCYIFKPTNLQSFMVTFSIIDKDSGYSCSISVLIPGSDNTCWDEIKNYQPIIDSQEKFTNAFIVLPDELITSNNHFPYTTTWNQRAEFKIDG